MPVAAARRVHDCLPVTADGGDGVRAKAAGFQHRERGGAEFMAQRDVQFAQYFETGVLRVLDEPPQPRQGVLRHRVGAGVFKPAVPVVEGHERGVDRVHRGAGQQSDIAFAHGVSPAWPGGLNAMVSPEAASRVGLMALSCFNSGRVDSANCSR